MNKVPTLVVMVGLVVIPGLGCDRSIGLNPGETIPIQIVDTNPEDLKKDGFSIGGVQLEGQVMQLIVVSGGGCALHEYALYMSPATFMESYPVQANVYLQHDDNDDPCDAIVTDTAYFDLSPVRTLYRQMYGQPDVIHLNLYDFAQTQSQKIVLSASN